MAIEPRNDLVLVRRLEEEYKGAIVLPDATKEKQLEAVVVAVGPGAYDDMGGRKPIELEVGDKVFIGRYSGTELVENGEKLIFLRESEILGRRR